MLNSYLSQIDKSNSKKKTYIVCNTTCDLDSVISAFSLSLYKNILEGNITLNNNEIKIKQESDRTFLPLINCYRGELKTRLDVMFVLKRFGVDSELFIYRNDLIVYEDLQDSKNTSIILVDHNSLDMEEQSVLELVEEIYDHHFDNQALNYPNLKTKNIIYPLGSCSTLINLLYYIANKKIKDIFDKLDINILLTTPVLIDTDNFKDVEYKHRWTDLDLYVFNIIKGNIDYDNYFKELCESKYNESENLGLGINNLMLKDKKVFKFHNAVVEWSTLPIPYKSIVYHYGWDSLIDYFKKQNCDIYICSSSHNKFVDRRVMVLYVNNNRFNIDEFKTFFETCLKEKVFNVKIKLNNVLVIDIKPSLTRKACEIYLKNYFLNDSKRNEKTI
jgi:inorganic pyrophosphatase/exopolyphosphatase